MQEEDKEHVEAEIDAPENGGPAISNEDHDSWSGEWSSMYDR